MALAIALHHVCFLFVVDICYRGASVGGDMFAVQPGSVGVAEGIWR